jgi:hypothetical protein
MEDFKKINQLLIKSMRTGTLRNAYCKAQTIKRSFVECIESKYDERIL